MDVPHAARSIVVTAAPESAFDIGAGVGDGGEHEWKLTPPSPSEAGHQPTAVSAVLSRLTVLPSSTTELQSVLDESAAICRDALSGDVEVSISIGSPLEPSGLAATDQLAQAVDGAQLTAEEGPCVTAFESGEATITDCVATDARWPRLSDHVPAEVKAVVSMPIEVGERVLGGLNVYHRAPGVDRHLVATAELLATALGAVLHELELRDELARVGEDMTRALSSRAVIEQAKGIVMAEKRIGPDEAFAHLAMLSSTQHRKLRDVAKDIVDGVAG